MGRNGGWTERKRGAGIERLNLTKHAWSRIDQACEANPLASSSWRRYNVSWRRFIERLSAVSRIISNQQIAASAI
jgi:hypothetical protein